MVLEELETLFCLLLLGEIFAQDFGHFFNGFFEGKWLLEVFFNVLGLLLLPEGILVLNQLAFFIFFDLGFIFLSYLGDTIDVVVFHCAVLHLAVADCDFNVLGGLRLSWWACFLGDVGWLSLKCMRFRLLWLLVDILLKRDSITFIITPILANCLDATDWFLLIVVNYVHWLFLEHRGFWLLRLLRLLVGVLLMRRSVALAIWPMLACFLDDLHWFFFVVLDDVHWYFFIYRNEGMFRLLVDVLLMRNPIAFLIGVVLACLLDKPYRFSLIALNNIHWLFFEYRRWGLFKLLADGSLLRDSVAFTIGPTLTLNLEPKIQQVGLWVVIENDFKQRLARHFILLLTLRTCMLRHFLNFPPISLKPHLIGKLINFPSPFRHRFLLLSEQHLVVPKLDVMFFFLGEQGLVVGIDKLMILFPLLLLLLQLVLPIFAKGLQFVCLAWWWDYHACWLLGRLLKLARLVRVLKCRRLVRGGLAALVNALTAMVGYSFRLR